MRGGGKKWKGESIRGQEGHERNKEERETRCGGKIKNGLKNDQINGQKPYEIFSKSLNIKKMHIKTSVLYHLIQKRLAFITKNNKFIEVVAM